MKKLLLLPLSLFALSGCDYYYQYKQCDPEKNYLITNIEAIEEYKTLTHQNLIQSHYIDIGKDNCGHLLKGCLLKYKHGKFYEISLNENDFKGIYKISISQDKTNPQCHFKPYDHDKNCYLIEKNVNDIIYSRYHFYQYKKDNALYMKLIDHKNGKILIDSAFQAYSTPNISGIGSGGFCRSLENNPSYKINLFKYPLL